MCGNVSVRRRKEERKKEEEERKERRRERNICERRRRRRSPAHLMHISSLSISSLFSKRKYLYLYM